MGESKKFPLISGYLSLDLINTEVVRRGKRHDLLLSEKDVVDWLHLMRENHLFWDDLFEKIASRMDLVVAGILEMRSILRSQFELVADGQPILEEWIIFLEEKIEKAPFTYKLMNQKLVPIPVGEVKDILPSMIALDALTLIEENKLSFLKRCSNPDCVLLFIDESGRRKWCSMKICGNRKKVARFQDKKLDNE